MKYLIAIIFFIALHSSVKSQQILPDSLRIAFQQAVDDSVKFKVSRSIYTFYEETNRDSALQYAQLRYALAKKYNRRIEEAYLQGQMAYQQIYLGRFSEALANLTAAIQIAKASKEGDTWELTPFNTPGKARQVTLSMLYHMYGHLKLQTGSTESIFYFKEGIAQPSCWRTGGYIEVVHVSPKLVGCTIQRIKAIVFPGRRNSIIT